MLRTVQDAPTYSPLFLRESPAISADAEHPLVSVCIANWNCREMLRACLLSLLDQEQGVALEVIVVDNASADGAADMVAEEFPDVILIRNTENVGFSRANNQAARAARGNYLFFLNNDTEVPPHAMVEFVEFALANPDVAMIGPRLRGADGTPQISYRAKPTLGALFHRISLLRWTRLFRPAYHRYRRETFDPHAVRPVEVLMGAAVFLPRAAFERSGCWDERYRFGGEDLDLSTQAGRFGEVVFFSDVEILHYGRVSSRANIGFSQPNVAIGYVHYFRKAGVGTTALLIYKILVTLDIPVQIIEKTVQTAFRYCTHRREKAQKSWLTVRGLWKFMRSELPRFWLA